jgi:phosphoribosylamine-glycine ligase
MEGNKGPNTGCAGNLVWIHNKPNRLINEGLLRMRDFLQQVGYRGMIDLNVIAGPDKLYGLEWTPRFGYDASATLFSLVTSDLGEFFHDIASGNVPTTLRWNENTFAAATRLSIPPYPTDVKGKHPQGVPIQGIDEEDIIRNCYLYDAMLEKGELVTAGVSGFVAVPIGVGHSIEEAWSGVKERIKKIKLPDMQYRQDLYKRTYDRYEGLARWGWFRE